MTLIWETQVLDCWRIELGLALHQEVIPHFERLERENKVPSFSVLLDIAGVVVNRYISLKGYEQALSLKANEASPLKSRFPVKQPTPSIPLSAQTPQDAEMIAEDSVDETVDRPAASTTKATKSFQEKPDFDGD
ncbi:hypothetical protein PM082_013334 [Marasmius tenuissimus]|nr:hypothetical protein PM082_013334 [Marasmius tenuissimus]